MQLYLNQRCIVKILTSIEQLMSPKYAPTTRRSDQMSLLLVIRLKRPRSYPKQLRPHQSQSRSQLRNQLRSQLRNQLRSQLRNQLKRRQLLSRKKAVSLMNGMRAAVVMSGSIFRSSNKTWMTH